PQPRIAPPRHILRLAIPPRFVIPSEARNPLFARPCLDPRHFRQLPHPRHQPCVSSPPHQEHLTIAEIQRTMNLALLLPRRLRRSSRLPSRRAQLHHRTSQTRRCPRRAHRRAQFHHGLIEITRTLPIQQSLSRKPKIFPRHPPPRKTLQHSLHIPIHHRHRLVECDAGNRRRRIPSHARQCPPFFGRLRKLAVALPHHNLRRRMQHARPPVIAQPAPRRQHRSLPRPGQL